VALLNVATNFALSVPPIKQRKIAISLAVAGATVAPFVFHTYKTPYPKWQTWTPLTAEFRQQITTNLPSCSITELGTKGRRKFKRFLREVAEGEDEDVIDVESK
jgi:hypothetical protein